MRIVSFLIVILFVNFSCSSYKEDLIDKLLTEAKQSERIYFQTHFQSTNNEIFSLNSVIATEEGLMLDSLFGWQENELVNRLSLTKLGQGEILDLQSAEVNGENSERLNSYLISPLQFKPNLLKNLLQQTSYYTYDDKDKFLLLYFDNKSYDSLRIDFSENAQIRSIRIYDNPENDSLIAEWNFNYLTEAQYKYHVNNMNSNIRSNHFL